MVTPPGSFFRVLQIGFVRPGRTPHLCSSRTRVGRVGVIAYIQETEGYLIDLTSRTKRAIHCVLKNSLGLRFSLSSLSMVTPSGSFFRVSQIGFVRPGRTPRLCSSRTRAGRVGVIAYIQETEVSLPQTPAIMDLDTLY
ncbi:hypothetical protein NDU88_005322 [Pleurodeles waltl]|uniref:Uncharacterized protein n=1 Tax=Pleurodeles waltl TaxID=8319 RepID=A0AAV7LX15_PLEWA|nr:hypothetical protein NDU88_005322 [Pleurodeles waltl]